MNRLAQAALAVVISVLPSTARAQLPVGVELGVRSPAPGEPAVDRMAVKVSLEGPSAAAVERVELAVDGVVVHAWREPPYEIEHDFGMSGRRRRISVRAFGASSVMAEIAFDTAEIRIDETLDLELQQIYVTVTDRRSRRVTDLEAEAFSVRDGGQTQEIVTFGVGEIPLTSVLLVDSSLSMREKRLEAAEVAARGFLNGMRPLDRAQLLSFSDHLLRATRVGGRESVLAELEAPLAASGGTAARDHLYLALQLLERRQGRRAVVMLTDGWDHVSVLSPADLENAAKRGQSVIYWIRLAGDEPTSFHSRSRSSATFAEFAAIRYNPAPSSWRAESEARRDYRSLEGLVERTGGRIVTVETLDEIAGAVAEVLAELHEQYAIGYYPDRASGPAGWRPVSVEVDRRGLKVRTPEGYVDR